MKTRKIIFHGDYTRCQRVLGEAKKRLEKLNDRIKRSNGFLKQGWQQQIPLSTGEIVQCHIGLAMDIVHIFAGGGERQVSAAEARRIVRECLCNCNFSVGTILSSELTGVPETRLAGVGSALAPYRVHVVEICQNQFTYVMFENIIGSDFTPWVPGQVVMVMAYHGFPFGCCYPDPEEAFGETFAATYSATGCAGKVDTAHNIDDDPFLGPDLDDEDWRTTYRIVPFCGLTLPVWKEKVE